jgi:AraC family ethanolamine operon transcriptional activator
MGYAKRAKRKWTLRETNYLVNPWICAPLAPNSRIEYHCISRISLADRSLRSNDVPGTAAMESELHIGKFRFQNVDDFHHCIRGADFEMVQLTRKPVKGRMIYAIAGNAMFSAGSIRGDVRSRGTLPTELTFGVHFGKSRSTVSQWDLDAISGDVFVMPSGTEQEGRVSGHISYATIAVPSHMMETIDIAGGWGRGLCIWNRIGRYRAPAHIREAIAAQVTTLVTRLYYPGVSSISAQALRRAMLLPFVMGLAFDTDQPEVRIAQPGANLVRKVEDWIEQVSIHNVHALDICAAFHVSLRTLQRAFHETVGMGPIAYLTKKRLAKVRSILLRKSPDKTNVTQVALDCGFWELGRFSVSYRRMFGESPSRTLARY